VVTSEENKNLDRSYGPSRRIKKRRDYLSLQASGKKKHSDHFLVSWRQLEGSRSKGAPAKAASIKSSQCEESRLGITVTKKVHKRAVRRNFIKRHVREFFRLNRQKLWRSVEVVVIAKSGAADLSGPEVLEEIESLFKAAGLFGRKSPPSGRRGNKAADQRADFSRKEGSKAVSNESSARKSAKNPEAKTDKKIGWRARGDE